VREYGEDVFSVDANVLFCKNCEYKIKSEKKYTVTQHLRTGKHIDCDNHNLFIVNRMINPFI